jgi:c(7)-type cytochrome triheme protein
MTLHAGAQRRPMITFWRLIFAALMVAGAYATYVRFARGLGASTHLSDRFPWGLWIGFDVMVGVGLAAGGFVISAVVHVFRIERYHSMARPAILTAFLGYTLVSVALAFDVGQPWRIWHPLVFWNPHSVMFEVAWCVMLYTNVLAVEFSPIVFERLGWKRPLRVVRALYTPFVIVGVLLSMMHQSSLGTMFVIAPDKLHGLWYTPWLPVFFFITAIAAGLGMTIVESYLSQRAFGHRLDQRLLEGAARVIVVLLAVYALWKTEDLVGRGNLGLVFHLSPESVMFWGEMGLGVFLPMLLFSIPATRRRPRVLFLGAVLTVLGFIVNRLNVSITGMQTASGAHYFPSALELVVTAAFVAAGFAIFAWAVKNLNVFAKHGEDGRDEPSSTPGLRRPLPVGGTSLAVLWGLLVVGAILLAVANKSSAAAAPAPAATVVLAVHATDMKRLPADFLFPLGDGSPGQVTFSHASHVARIDAETPACMLCHHQQGFVLRQAGKPRQGSLAMERMHQGQLCGQCHDGTKAVGLDDCTVCHQ